MTDVTKTHDAGEPGPVVKTTPEEGGPPHSHSHPTEKQYIGIALILGVITLAEVGVYYIKSLGNLLVYILIAMSFVKFSLVVAFFMHLRFDSKLFRRLFITVIILALFVYTIVLTTFHIFTRQ